MKQSIIQNELLAALVGRQPDNALRGIRVRALERFSNLGLPDTSQEDWKYTSLEPAIRLSNAWLQKAASVDSPAPGEQATELPRQPIESAIDAHWIRFLNGRPDGNIGIDLTVDSVEISLLPTAGQQDSLVIGDGISSYNAALLDNVLTIRIPAGVEVDKPIGILLASDASGSAAVSATRVVLELGENAKAEFIEDHLSVSTGEAYSNVVIELKLGPGATLNYLRIQENNASTILTGKLVADLGANSVFDYSSLDLGGALIRNDVTAAIAASGAAFNANGLYLANGSQHIDNHLRVDHRVGPARSRAEFRGILNDKARCVFNSKAIVHKGADGTDAGQSNHNLLLSDKAEIDTKPELEIYADDVKCAHGATVGQLDKEALFYLKSRGIDADEASRLITRAFAASVLAGFPVSAANDFVSGLVDRKLDALINE